MVPRPSRSTLFPYTTLFRSSVGGTNRSKCEVMTERIGLRSNQVPLAGAPIKLKHARMVGQDRKSTRLNSSHRCISYAVFCLKKKKTTETSDNVSTTSNAKNK